MFNITSSRTTSYCLIQSLGFEKKSFMSDCTNYTHWYTMLSGNLFDLLQIDPSKAFDLVNHTLLLEKLKLYRCNTDTICWFQSSLKNRSQLVYVKDTLSQLQTINSDVPSILGPLLFLIYMNDMSLYMKQINAMLYADDATISASGERIVGIENTLSDSGNSASDSGASKNTWLSVCQSVTHWSFLAKINP